MTRARHRQDADSFIQALPEAEVSSAGYVFFPREDRWVLLELNQRLSLCFADHTGMDSSLKIPLKLVLCWFARNHSGSYTREVLKKFKKLFHHASMVSGQPVKEVTAATLINYRAALGERQEWKLGSLGSAIKRWHGFGYPGIRADAVAYLDSTSIKGNEKGVAVATLDPLLGPLTDIEFEALCDSLASELAKDALSLDERVAIWLFLILGPRPVQIAALKVCDHRSSTGPEGERTFVLMVPDAKQRRPIRKTFRPRAVPASIGILLEQQAEVARAMWRAQSRDETTAPLLPRKTNKRFDHFEGQGHLTSRQLSTKVIRALQRIAPYSERTGERLRITPSRLRYTLGTRAAQEGLSDAVIAWLLGHSDLQSVGVYRGLADAMALRISHKMSFALAPLARAFQGIVVEDGHSEGQRITDPRFDETMTHPLGSCEACNACDLGAPLDCYLCPRFRPWRNGPHAEVHSYLLSERARLATTCGERIAAVHDRTILAVAEVITRCQTEPPPGDPDA